MYYITWQQYIFIFSIVKFNFMFIKLNKMKKKQEHQ